MNDSIPHVELIASVFAALGHPNRIRIVEFLRGGEKCQCEIQPAIGLEQSNLSRHIKILLQAGVLSRRKEGTRTMLAVTDRGIFALIDQVRAARQSRPARRPMSLSS